MKKNVFEMKSYARSLLLNATGNPLNNWFD